MRRRDFLKGLLAGTAAAVLGVAPKQVGDSPESTRRNGVPSWRFTDEQIAEVAGAWMTSGPRIIRNGNKVGRSAATKALLKARQYWT